MSIKQLSKVAINSIENDINGSDIDKIKKITEKESSALLNTINSSKDFFVDQEMVESIEKIKNNMSVKEIDWQAKSDQLKGEMDILKTEVNSIRSQLGIRNVFPSYIGPFTPTPAQKDRYNKMDKKESDYHKKDTEKKKIDSIIGDLRSRKTEYEDLFNVVNEFDLTRNLPDMKGDKYVVAGDLMKSGKSANGYKLYDENGNELPSKFFIDIKLDDGSSENVEITGLKILPKKGEIDISGLGFKDRYGKSYIPKQGYEFIVYPGASKEHNKGGVTSKFIHSKPLKIIRPKPMPAGSLTTIPLRQIEIDKYNTTAPGNNIKNKLSAEYTNNFNSYQRDAVWEALRHLDGVRVAELEDYGKKTGREDEIKEEVYQQIYRNVLSIGSIAANLASINDYANFSNWFIDNSRSWNSDFAVIESALSYQNYIHNNLTKNIQDYMKDTLKDLLSNSTTTNMRLKTELNDFLTQIEKRRDDAETNTAGDTIQTATEGQITKDDQMTKYRRGKFLGIPFGRPDVNYMRFYSGASYEIKDQSVDIATNTRVIDKNNPEPVKYDIKTEIAGKNNISVTIDFPNKDKRYRKKQLKLKQGEVSTLARKILNCPEIPDFKVRTHIVYNMLVSMIKIAEQKNLGLKYRNGSKQRELVMNDKNISLQEWDDTGGVRTEKTLFDYDSFITTNTFHGRGDSRSLQTGIDELMKHFNYSMNQYHEQYRNATKSRIFGSLLKTKVSANSFWTSPIKTIRNLRTVRVFDFTTNVGDVQITFEKNKITLNKGDVEIFGTNLGKLLEHREKKVRIFDGMERDIVQAFYSKLIEKLRENSKINRSNFAVRDELTQNIYVIDEDGEMGIVTPEDPGNILDSKDTYGVVKKTELDAVDVRGGRRMCNEKETKELFMNPAIMGRMIKAMNKRMRGY